MKLAFIPTIIFVCILWLIFLLEVSLDLKMYKLGVYPLKVEGLYGILLSPLIHSTIKHLFSNTIPLLVLMWCLFFFYREIAYKTFIFLWLLSGVLTWVIGREAWHIGASGIIYSLSFFLFFSGIFRKHIPLIAISLIVAFLYGSNVWNMLPLSIYVDPAVSWEGHLSGAISGLIGAIVYRKYGPQKPQKIWLDEEYDLENETLEEEDEFTERI